jgi:ABC-type uncharacterized transport system ATPase subunit
LSTWTSRPSGWTSAAKLIAGVAARYRLRDLTIEEPAIEDIVRHIYGYGLGQPEQTAIRS